LKLVSSHPSVRLNLDMKEYSAVQEMAQLVTRSGMASRVLLTGVTSDAVAKVQSGAEGLPYLLNAKPSPRQCLTASGASALARTIRAVGALGLNVHHRFITRRLARSLSADGLSVSVWTVDSARGMRRMLRLPVDNVTTRRVDQMLALRGGMVP
jgi:glycerophosphoryl diester phosphodiesterase